MDGDTVDLLVCEQMLRRPHDPVCEKISFNESFIWGLYCEIFEDLANPSDVMKAAIPLIAKINGALAVNASVESLRINGVCEIRESRIATIHVFAEAHIRGRSVVLANGQAVHLDGSNSSENHEAMSSVQKLIKAAEGCDKLADMLVFAGRSDNWFDVYKTLEMAEKIIGGVKKMSIFLGSFKSKYDSVRTTANFHRHARGYKPPSLATLRESKEVISTLLARIGEEKYK